MVVWIVGVFVEFNVFVVFLCGCVVDCFVGDVVIEVVILIGVIGCVVFWLFVVEVVGFDWFVDLVVEDVVNDFVVDLIVLLVFFVVFIGMNVFVVFVCCIVDEVVELLVELFDCVVIDDWLVREVIVDDVIVFIG